MTADEIFEKAHARCQLAADHSGSYYEGLQVLTEAIRGDRLITSAFRDNLKELLTATLVVRLAVDDYIAGHPDVRRHCIAPPVVVSGLPRTGTTLVSHLLGTDPGRRSLLNWEAAEPVPPATSETLLSDPRCIRKRVAQELILALDPRLARVHWEFAGDPTECDSVMSQDFKSAHWAILVPSYGEWLRRCDMTSAYSYHKSVLQILQSATHGRWNLKSTCHGLFTGTLRKTYPDVRLIWIHRDPWKALASTCSLVRTQQAILGAEIRVEVIRESCVAYVAEILSRLAAANGELPGGTIYHLSYRRLLDSPIEQMRQLYGWLGDEFTPQVERGMQSWLSAHPRGKYGKHQYSSEEFNISESILPAIFAEYARDFGVERER